MRRREIRRREFVALFSAAAAAWPLRGTLGRRSECDGSGS